MRNCKPIESLCAGRECALRPREPMAPEYYDKHKIRACKELGGLTGDLFWLKTVCKIFRYYERMQRSDARRLKSLRRTWSPRKTLGQCIGWPYFPEWHHKSEVAKRLQILKLRCSA